MYMLTDVLQFVKTLLSYHPLSPIIFLTLPFNSSFLGPFPTFMPFLCVCFGAPLLLIRFVCMNMVGKVFTRARASYPCLYHRGIWLLILQQPVTLYSSSGRVWALRAPHPQSWTYLVSVSTTVVWSWAQLTCHAKDIVFHTIYDLFKDEHSIVLLQALYSLWASALTVDCKQKFLGREQHWYIPPNKCNFIAYSIIELYFSLIILCMYILYYYIHPFLLFNSPLTCLTHTTPDFMFSFLNILIPCCI